MVSLSRRAYLTLGVMLGGGSAAAYSTIKGGGSEDNSRSDGSGESDQSGQSTGSDGSSDTGGDPDSSTDSDTEGNTESDTEQDTESETEASQESGSEEDDEPNHEELQESPDEEDLEVDEDKYDEPEESEVEELPPESVSVDSSASETQDGQVRLSGTVTNETDERIDVVDLSVQFKSGSGAPVGSGLLTVRDLEAGGSEEFGETFAVEASSVGSIDLTPMPQRTVADSA